MAARSLLFSASLTRCAARSCHRQRHRQTCGQRCGWRTDGVARRPRFLTSSMRSSDDAEIQRPEADRDSKDDDDYINDDDDEDGWDSIPFVAEDEELQDDDDFMVVDEKDLRRLLVEIWKPTEDSDDDGAESKKSAEARTNDNVALHDEFAGDTIDVDNTSSEEHEDRKQQDGQPEYMHEFSDEEERATVETLLEAYQNRDLFSGPDKDSDNSYFKEENVEYMPGWAQQLYRSGEWRAFVEESDRLSTSRVIGERRLDDRPAGSTFASTGLLEEYTVGEIADDYRLPVEVIIDEMMRLGVEVPIEPSERIKDRLTSEQVESLVDLVTSFDCFDLSDRYSDKTIAELAEDYDVTSDWLSQICHEITIPLTLGERTHLLCTQEAELRDRLEELLGY